MDNEVHIEIRERHLNAFLACLGIGTLQAIKQGIISPDVGIMALGNPEMWEYLSENPTISREIVSVFQTSDELSAIEKLIPEEFDKVLSELISRLHRELENMGEPTWYFIWSD